MEILAVLSIQTIVVAVLAALGVADMYRVRQSRHYRVVVYPRKRAA